MRMRITAKRNATLQRLRTTAKMRANSDYVTVCATGDSILVVRCLIDCDVDCKISIVPEMRGHRSLKYETVITAYDTGDAAVNTGVCAGGGGGE